MVMLFYVVEQVGGVHTNFRMPDVISIGLGGGSIVSRLDNKVMVAAMYYGCSSCLLTRNIYFRQQTLFIFRFMLVLKV